MAALKLAVGKECFRNCVLNVFEMNVKLYDVNWYH
jgi:hypothetical protein